MNRKNQKNIDPSSIANQTYSESAGAQKNTEVGRHLVPLKSDGTTYTTDATTVRALPSKGKNLAIYNNSTILYAVTLGSNSSIAALASGVTDANGNVGIPCEKEGWTYIACNDKQYVITQNAALMVFLIEDDSSIS